MERKPYVYPETSKRAGALKFKCIKCETEQNKSYRKRNYLKVLNKERNLSLKRLYGITLNDYNIMLEKQNYRCAACNTDKPDGHGNFHTDHDHKTGQVRGLLCNGCNRALGFIDDSIDKLKGLIQYLQSIPGTSSST